MTRTGGKEMTDKDYCAICMDINCTGCPYIPDENRWNRVFNKK